MMNKGRETRKARGILEKQITESSYKYSRISVSKKKRNKKLT